MNVRKWFKDHWLEILLIFGISILIALVLSFYPHFPCDGSDFVCNCTV